MWIGRGRTTRSTVWSSAIHSQASMEAIPHLYKQERKRPKPVRKRLSRTQAVFGRVILREWVTVSGMKMRSLIGLSAYSAFHWWSPHCVPRMLLLSDKLKGCCAAIWGAVQLHSMEKWALSGEDVHASWHGVLETVWFHCDEAQQVGCLRGWEGCVLLVGPCGTQASSHNSQGVVDGGVDEAGMSTAAPHRSAALCSSMYQG